MLPQVGDLPDRNRDLADLRCREGGPLLTNKASKSGGWKDNVGLESTKRC